MECRQVYGEMGGGGGGGGDLCNVGPMVPNNLNLLYDPVSSIKQCYESEDVVNEPFYNIT